MCQSPNPWPVYLWWMGNFLALVRFDVNRCQWSGSQMGNMIALWSPVEDDSYLWLTSRCFEVQCSSCRRPTTRFILAGAPHPIPLEMQACRPQHWQTHLHTSFINHYKVTKSTPVPFTPSLNAAHFCFPFIKIMHFPHCSSSSPTHLSTGRIFPSR